MKANYSSCTKWEKWPVLKKMKMSSKLFLEFVTLIVRNRMYSLLKEEMLRIETNPDYLTVPAAIRELLKNDLSMKDSSEEEEDEEDVRKENDYLD